MFSYFFTVFLHLQICLVHRHVLPRNDPGQDIWNVPVFQFIIHYASEGSFMIILPTVPPVTSITAPLT